MTQTTIDTRETRPHSEATARAVRKYGAVACTMAFDLNESGEGASTIQHGHDCGFPFTTVSQVDAAINAGRELHEGRKWTASHAVEAKPDLSEPCAVCGWHGCTDCANGIAPGGAMGTVPTPAWCENQIKIAADGVAKLRGVDVFRVLDTVEAAYRVDLADYIKAQRPELSYREIAEVLTNYAEEEE